MTQFRAVSRLVAVPDRSAAVRICGNRKIIRRLKHGLHRVRLSVRAYLERAGGNGTPGAVSLCINVGIAQDRFIIQHPSYKHETRSCIGLDSREVISHPGHLVGKTGSSRGIAYLNLAVANDTAFRLRCHFDRVPDLRFEHSGQGGTGVDLQRAGRNDTTQTVSRCRVFFFRKHNNYIFRLTGLVIKPGRPDFPVVEPITVASGRTD